MHLNIEIKARCHDPQVILEKLLKLNADDRGIDHQVDTYFNCQNGRLKLRKGNIENSLIFYQRSDQAGPKASDVFLERLPADNDLVEVLTASLGISKVVDKKRHILFIDNVKFHIDEVKDLGHFMEIEAIDHDGSLGKEHLLSQCNHYMDLLKVETQDLLTFSYSDML